MSATERFHTIAIKSRTSKRTRTRRHISQRSRRNRSGLEIGLNVAASVATHEVGHLAGLVDEYDTRTGAAYRGYETNLMGSFGQYGITESQIQEMLYGTIKANSGEHNGGEKN